MSLGTAISLSKLNSLRAERGMKPLKAWKESKAKLAERIASMQAKNTEEHNSHQLRAESEPDDPLPDVDANLPPRGTVVDTTEIIDIPVPPKKRKPTPQVKALNGMTTLGVTPKAADPTLSLGVLGPTPTTESDTYMGVKITKCPPAAELSAAQKRRDQIAAIADKRMKGDTTAKLPTPERKPDPDARKPEKKTKAPYKRTRPEGMISLADICRELSMDPKVGRAKMRRIPDAELADIKTDTKLIYRLEHKSKVIDLLKKDLRK